MRILFSPRLWLFIWLGLGAVALSYVILAASLSGGAAGAAKKPAFERRDPAFLMGEMADFTYAFPARRAPEETFLHEGKEMTLRDFRGKAVLVNFWATWCAPCLKELPSLDALEGELGGADFQVVAVAADPRGPEVATQFLDKLGIEHLRLYADPQLSLAIAIGGAAVLPVSVLYDADGNEVGRLVGEADWTAPESKRLIGSAIGN